MDQNKTKRAELTLIVWNEPYPKRVWPLSFNSKSSLEIFYSIKASLISYKL